MMEHSFQGANFPFKSGALPGGSRGTQRSAPYYFTYDDLHKCLYQRGNTEAAADVQTNMNDSNGLKDSQAWSPNTAERSQLAITYAMKTCPNELQLCSSSIPGFTYGIRTKQVIPEGTWMGPYQGTVVKPSDVTSEMDTSYMWEIYEDGKLLHYIDGSNENTSSWMRFICCARHRKEQNLFAFQYKNEIYYRAFTKIPAGAELLVWYDEDKYPHFMGIPLVIRGVSTHLDHSKSETDPCPLNDVSNSHKQHADWRKETPPTLCESTVTARLPSAVIASAPARDCGPPFLVPRDFHNSSRRPCPPISFMPRRIHYRQGDLPQRVVLLKKAKDAPDPFCVLREEKKTCYYNRINLEAE